LERQIHEITGISLSALRHTPLSQFNIEERLSWMKDRHTTRKEDRVYSLLGIFGIFLVPNYGEGEDYAFRRFLKEIDEVSKGFPHQQALPQAGKLQAVTIKSITENAQGSWYICLLID
jgi:hypothetical protein